jgi:hypothetical protein
MVTSSVFPFFCFPTFPALVPYGGMSIDVQGLMLLSQFSAIFANFWQKMALFSKTNVMIKLLHNLPSKMPIFR